MSTQNINLGTSDPLIQLMQIGLIAILVSLYLLLGGFGLLGGGIVVFAFALWLLAD